MWGAMGKPTLPTPAVVDDPTGRKCLETDELTGAVCTRNLHVVDKTHWFEDQDFKIQWVNVPRLMVP